VIEKKKCSKDGHLERVVGYYEGWAARRPCNAFFPEMIPRGVYSIINFAFATIDPVTFEVLPSSPEDVDLYGRLTALKQHDPGLKVFIALGGWTFNDEGPTMTTFSDISRSEANQRKFFKSLIAFLHKYDFDGVDLDWEYPVADDRFGRPEDFGNFPKMMLNLKNELKHTGGRNGLSITLPASFWYLQHFDLAGLKKSVDFFAVMSYDLHGTWDMGKKWTGEYLNPHTNITEIDAALDLLWRNDIDPGMVVMGLAFYARSYTLADPSCTEPRCTYVSASRKGKCSNEAGILLNSEIDDIVKERGLTPVLWEKETVKVVHWDDQWLSYDDAETLKMKADYARSLCLGGVMVWAISHDTTGLGSGVLGKRQNGASTLVGKYTRALAKVTNRKATDGRSLTDPDDEEERYEEIKVHHPVCRWTGCLENCPSGWQHMKREDDRARKDEYMWDETGCDKTGSHKLCCPPNEKKPTCGWYTHPKKGGKCKSECPAGTLEIGGNSMYCSSSYQAACCTVDDDQGKGLRAMDVYDTCNWAEAPLCDWGTCGDREELVLSTSGNGGAICNVRSFEWGKSVTIQQRKYCCDQNDNKKKWDNCQWYDKEGDYEAGLRCSPNCPKDKTRVAMDSWGGDCRDSGARVYCCDTDNYHLEKREIDDGLGAYRTAMGWFVKDPTCPATVSSDGDEWTIDDAEIERRQQPPDIGYSRIQLVHNLLSTVLEQAYQVPTRAQQDMMDLWDDYIKGNWPGLVVRLLVPYILDQYATAYKVEGARKTADRILCALDVFNQMVQALKTALICSDNLCGVDDLCSDSFDEDAQPKSNPLRVRQDMNEIEKRRPMNVGGDINWDCIDDANPNGRRIRWKKADYFSVNDWDDANTIYDNALRPIIPGHCSLTRLATVDYEFEPDTRPYCTEHIIEMQSMKIFFGEAANGMISGCNLPCDFFLNGWNDPALLGGLGPAPGGYQTGKPSERVMEAVGSDDNTANFAILEADLNGMKARVSDPLFQVPSKHQALRLFQC